MPAANDLIGALPSGELHDALTALAVEVEAEVNGTDSGAFASALGDGLRTGNATSVALLVLLIRWRAVQAEHRRQGITE